MAGMAPPARPRRWSIEGRPGLATSAASSKHSSSLFAVNPDGNRDGLSPATTSRCSPAHVRGEGVFRCTACRKDPLTIELGDVIPELQPGKRGARLVGNKVVPYYSRADIVDHAKGTPPVLLWVDDPIELFFLQIGGSGRVRLPSGDMVRGRLRRSERTPYQSIGRVLIERGELLASEASMQKGIQAWARANPAKLGRVAQQQPELCLLRELIAEAVAGRRAAGCARRTAAGGAHDRRRSARDPARRPGLSGDHPAEQRRPLRTAW